jgi:hypothetical protein
MGDHSLIQASRALEFVLAGFGRRRRHRDAPASA